MKLTEQQETVLRRAFLRALEHERCRNQPAYPENPTDEQLAKYSSDILAFELGWTLKPRQIVFVALEMAMDTLRRLPDVERGWLGMRTNFPSSLVIDDSSEKYRESLYWEIIQMIRDGKIGNPDIEDDRFAPRSVPTSKEITEMEVVFEVYRSLLVGRPQNHARDWRILCWLAAGMTMMEVGKRIGFRHKNQGNPVQKRKELQCVAIAYTLKDVMPEQLSW